MVVGRTCSRSTASPAAAVPGTPCGLADHLCRRGRGAGLAHPTVYGGIDRKRFIIETNGSGVALVDYDVTAGLTRWCSAARDCRGHEGRRELPAGGSANEPALPEQTQRHIRRRDRCTPAFGVPAGPRASARATTTTTAGSTCSSPTTAGTCSTAIAAMAGSRTRPPRPVWRHRCPLGIGLHVRGLRSRRAARSVRRQLPAVRSRDGG